MARTTFKKCFLTGKKDEKDFIEHINNTYDNISIRESTEVEDMKKHIDGYINIRGKEYSYDFKGIKRIKRGGPLRPDMQWLELESGYENRGSLYGEEHYIIFKQEDHYLLFRREHILQYLLPLVDGQTTLIMPKKEDDIKLYQKYHRNGRMRTDCIVLVPTEDLRKNIIYRKLK